MKPETRIVVISISKCLERVQSPLTSFNAGTVVVCAITCSIVVCILVAVRRHHIHKSATGNGYCIMYASEIRSVIQARRTKTQQCMMR